MVGEPLAAAALEIGVGTDRDLAGELTRQTGEALAAELSRRRTTFGDLTFTTRDELPPLPGLVGQERALEAVGFGIAMQRPGRNVFAFGRHGSGKRSLVQQLLEQRAASEPVPPDWLGNAVFAFAEPDRAVVFISSAADIRDLAERASESRRKLMFEPRSDEIAAIRLRSTRLDPCWLVVSAEGDMPLRKARADATSWDRLIVK